MSNYEFALNRLGSLTREYRKGYISKRDFQREVEFLVSRISDIYEASDIRDFGRNVLADPNYKLPLPEPELPKNEAKERGSWAVFFGVLLSGVIALVSGVIGVFIAGIVALPFVIGFNNEELGTWFLLLGFVGGLIGGYLSTKELR